MTFSNSIKSPYISFYYYLPKAVSKVTLSFRAKETLGIPLKCELIYIYPLIFAVNILLSELHIAFKFSVISQKHSFFL